MRKLWVRSLLCFSLSCATSLSATLVSAAPPRQSDDDATVAIARERFKEGVAFFDKKEFDKARLAFLQAYALKKHPAVLLNLAQSELRSSHEAEAAKHFSAYLRESKDASDAERQAAEAGLNATRAAVAEVDVDVDESSAEIYLDSSLEGLSPLPGPLYVTPGSHSVEARKAGKSATAQISATAGKQLHANLTFAAKPPPAPAASAVHPSESAAEPEPAPESSAGRKPFFSWLVSSPVGIVGLGLTGVGLGVGVGTALASNHAYNNADSIAEQIKRNAASDAKAGMLANASTVGTSDLCTDPGKWLMKVNYPMSGYTPNFNTRTGEYKNACAKYPDTTKNGDTLKTVATVSFIVGGVAAVGTIVYYFLDPNAVEGHEQASKPGRRSVAIVPTVSATQGSLTLTGTF